MGEVRMTPEDRAALRDAITDWRKPVSTALLTRLLSALEEAERERNEVWQALCGIDLGRRPIDFVSEVLRDPAVRTRFLVAWVEDDQAERAASESESAALRAEVETLTREARDLRSRSAADAEWMAQAVESIEGLTVTTPDFTGHPVVDVVRSLLAEVERMRGALLGLVAWCEQGAWEGEDGGTTRLNAARAALSGGEGGSHGG